ncbi:hypothetical protein TWF730_009354 [Orbilia blumenaviensis]|uniref:Protein kinase domain-containing protein n=1 Tax=Orbilia blumenaviensis TaxID=1796055 RepID=A0AAV9UYY8_9PEZI
MNNEERERALQTMFPSGGGGSLPMASAYSSVSSLESVFGSDQTESETASIDDPSSGVPSDYNEDDDIPSIASTVARQITYSQYHQRLLLPSDNRNDLLQNDFVALTDCIVQVAPADPTSGMQKLSVSEIAAPGISIKADGNAPIPAEYQRRGLSAFTAKIARATLYNGTEDDAIIYRGIIQALKILRHPRLHDHPNFTRLIQVVWRPYSSIGRQLSCGTVTEGKLGTLQEFMETSGDIVTYAEIRHLILDISMGLQALRWAGYAFGKVSMSSIVVCLRECEHFVEGDKPCLYTAKLADFELSMSLYHQVFASRGLSGLANPVGVYPIYAAPWLQDVFSPSLFLIIGADTYALGILIWVMVNRGKDPLWLIPTDTPSANLAERFETFEQLKKDDVLRGEIFLQLETLGLPQDELLEVMRLVRSTVHTDFISGPGLIEVTAMLKEKVECSSILNRATRGEESNAAEDYKLHRPIGAWQIGTALSQDPGLPPQAMDQLRQTLQDLAQIDPRSVPSPPNYAHSNFYQGERGWIPLGLRATRNARAALEYAQIFARGRNALSPTALNYLTASKKLGSLLAQAILVTLQDDYLAGQGSDSKLMCKVAGNGCFQALSRLRKRRDMRFQSCLRWYCHSWARIYDKLDEDDRWNAFLDHGSSFQAPDDMDFDSLLGLPAQVESQRVWVCRAAIIGNLALLQRVLRGRRLLESGYETRPLGLINCCHPFGEVSVWEYLPGSTVGETPLFLACRSRQWDVAAYLLQEGANPNILTGWNQGPLHWTALCLDKDEQALDLAKHLIDKEANLNAVSRLNRWVDMDAEARDRRFLRREISTGTPLHWAVYSGYQDMVSLLLASGARPDIINEESETSIEIAARFHRWEILALLLCKAQELRPRGLAGMFPSEKIFLTALDMLKRPLDLYYMTEGYNPKRLIETLLLPVEYGFVVTDMEVWRKVNDAVLEFCSPEEWSSFNPEWQLVYRPSR